MEAARKEMESVVAKQRIDFAKKSRTKSMNASNILPRSEVLARREKKALMDRALQTIQV